MLYYGHRSMFRLEHVPLLTWSGEPNLTCHGELVLLAHFRKENPQDQESKLVSFFSF